MIYLTELSVLLNNTLSNRLKPSVLTLKVDVLTFKTVENRRVLPTKPMETNTFLKF